MHPMTALSPAIDESSPRYAGWRVVLACFLIAMLGWGFALYGHGVYLTALNHLHGWPTAAISVGVTGFYLLTATLVVFISDAFTRFGPRHVILTGTVSFVAAIAVIGTAGALWQVYAAYVLMAIGTATMHVGAISNLIGLWFDEKRSLAVSLALNGASSGGILITPLLVLAISEYGFSRAMIGSAAFVALVLVPVIALWVDRPPAAAAHEQKDAPAATWTRQRVLRSWRFWSVAAPFALALTAQVGFLVHQIAILQPVMGRAQAGFSVAALTVASITGRLLLGAFAGRVDLRVFSAVSLTSQAAALAAMASLDGAYGLLAACLVFGLSAGNIVTLPSLVIHREFEAASFGMLVGLSWATIQVTYSFGPGIMGALHDLTGGYGAALSLCIALQLVAAVLVMLRPRAQQAPVDFK
jgi:MFS family permease